MKYILCADLHLRDDKPICRTDNYWETQKRKLQFIIDQAKKHNAGILCAGDIFHRATKCSFELLNLFSKITVYHRFSCIPGNHDLIGGETNSLHQTAFGLLLENKIIEYPNVFYIKGFPFGAEIKRAKDKGDKWKFIALIHQMVINDKTLWEGQSEYFLAKSLLKKYNFDLIVSGDNHQSFIVEYKNKFLVNPGSMMRMTAAQIDHEPKIYLYDTEKHEVKTIKIPIEKGVIDISHITNKKQKNEDIEKLINSFSKDQISGETFQEKMKFFLEQNKIPESIKQIIFRSME